MKHFLIFLLLGMVFVGRESLFGAAAPAIPVAATSTPVPAAVPVVASAVAPSVTVVLTHAQQIDDIKSRLPLNNQTLENMDLSEMLKPGADFTGSTFKNVLFAHATLPASKFNNAKLAEASFANAHIEGAEFKGAILTGANLEGVRAAGVDFTGADLTNARVLEADLSGAKFNTAILNGLVATNPKNKNNERPVKIDGADFTGAFYNSKPIEDLKTLKLIFPHMAGTPKFPAQ